MLLNTLRMPRNRGNHSDWKQYTTSSYSNYSSATSDINSASPSNLAAQGFVVEHQPIALFRSELEKLEHILLFPEEVAFQLSATEYKLFYEIQPMDYIRYVSSNLTSRSVAENPSPVRNLVKRLSEISSWITHLIISLPTDEDRKTRVTTILRIIDTCWSIGNFNAAVEILIGLKSEKLRPFWLSLKPEEKKKYEELCEILLPSDQTAVSPTYREAIQRALKMPQCKLIPFFGVFLRDLYAIVNDLPSIVMSADEGVRDKPDLTKEHNGNDYCASKIEVTGLLNADKINLVVVVLDNLELFHRHYKNRRSFILDQAESSTRKKKRKAKVPIEYESVQAVEGSSKNVTLIPLDTNHFNLDVIQRLHHGTTVIRFDPETGRSTLCLLKLHASCGLLSWHKVGSFKTKDIRDKDTYVPPMSGISNSSLQSLTTTESCNPTLSPCTRPSGAVYATMDNGFLRLYDVKSVESVGSHEIDIESIYRRHSNEEMSVSIECWAINYGCHLSDNEFFYFIAPKKSAQCWLNGLIDIVNYMMEERKYADRRIIWLKKLYLQLCIEHEQDRIFDPCAKYCPQLSEALQAFGGQSKELKNLAMQQIGLNASKKVTTGKSRLKQVTSAVTRRMKTGGYSTTLYSPQPFASIKTRYSSMRNRVRDKQSTSPDSSSLRITSSASSIHSWYTFRRSKNSKNESLNLILTKKNPVTSELFQEDYSEKPLTLLEFIELYKLFNIQMRKDLKNIFNDVITMCAEKGIHCDHYGDQTISKAKPSDSNIQCIPTDFLTRNNFTSREIYERQQNIHNALTLATTNSTGSMDTSKTLFLTPRMLQKFIEIHQMEIVDEDYAAKLIEEHEPDISNRINKLLSFEGFVRYLTDSNNYAFVPEAIKPDASTLHYPLSYYYICSSHNTYLTGHQLKGESSTEMYRQVLLTGCRCIELDCWDGENGRPQIFHGHTLTSKIDFSQVLNAIRKNAFVTSSLPVILSIENHCSLQQQARMAQMFQNYLDEKLVRHFLFAADYSDSPRLPSPWQLQNKILIKDKKMIAEPSAGLSVDKYFRNEGDMTFEQTDGSYGVDEDDLEESDNYEDPNDDNEEDSRSSRAKRLSKIGRQNSFGENEEAPKNLTTKSVHAVRLASEACDKRTSYEVLSAPSETVSPRSMKKGPGIALAPELSDLVNYLQAVKFKGFPRMMEFVLQQQELTKSTTIEIARTNSNSLLMPNSQQQSYDSSQSFEENKLKLPEEISLSGKSFSAPKSNAPCYQVTSLNEPSARKLSRKHPLKFIAYSRDQIVRTYPGGIRIDSSNFNPIQYWSFGIQMVALNFQTADTAMAVNTAMFEQNGNCGYVLKPRVFWDISHPLYNRFNPRSKDISLQSALLYKITIISGQHVCPNQHAASSYVELEIIGLPADCAKEKSKTVSRNSVNPIWNYTTTFRIVFVELAFLRISICDSTNGRCIAQRVVPVRFIRAGYRHLPLRTPANVPIEQGTVFLYSRFEQEEYIHVHECDDDTYEFNVHQPLYPQMLSIDPAANLKTVPILRRQIFVLQVSGLYNDDTMVTVHVGLSSTVKNVIQMALINAGKNADTVEDYILAELTIKRFSADSDEQCAHRILQPNELIMDSVACWNGSIRRFVIKKKETDSGSRTWINSLIKSGMTMPSSSLASLSPSSSMSPSEKRSNSGVRGQQSPFQVKHTVKKTFLVCVHNVSKNQPYIILRANINSMASDIIKQVFLQTRQTDINETEFVLVEETLKDFSLRTAKSQQSNQNLRKNYEKFILSRKKSVESTDGSWLTRLKSSFGSENLTLRVLGPEENVYKAQSMWKTSGRFILENRNDTIRSAQEQVRNLLQALENACISSSSKLLNTH